VEYSKININSITLNLLLTKFRFTKLSSIQFFNLNTITRLDLFIHTCVCNEKCIGIYKLSALSNVYISKDIFEAICAFLTL